ADNVIGGSSSSTTLHCPYSERTNATKPSSPDVPPRFHPYFTDIFSRLVVLAESKPDATRRALSLHHPLKKNHPQHLTLCRPISLSTLTQVFTPVKPGGTRAASFIGSQVPNSIRKVSATTPLAKPMDMAKCLPTTEATEFTLIIEAEGDASGVAEALKVVLEYLKAYAGSKKVIMRERCIKVVLHCAPSVLHKWIELFREAQPLFLALEVELFGIFTRQYSRRYVIALADIYAQHWTHRISESHATFVSIGAYAPTLHQRDIDDLKPEDTEFCGGYHAELITGHDDPDPAIGPAGGDPDRFMFKHGFTARIQETRRHPDFAADLSQTVFEQAYPMARVPIPPVDAVQETLPTANFPPGVLRHHLRYHQRRTDPELSARLMAAGYDVPGDPVPAPPRPARARAAVAGAIPEEPAVGAGAGAAGQ
ncbi:hypothetical protein NCC49_000367, partial [Naganishia albida]